LNAGHDAATADGGAAEVDVIIVGGGLVGSVLAMALQSLPLRCALIEARDPRVLAQPSFDDRSTALAEGSRRILDGLGLWSSLVGQAEPINCIHVCERGRFGAARLRAGDHGVAALGYTWQNRVVGQVVWDALSAAPRLTTLAPARVLEVNCDKRMWSLSTSIRVMERSRCVDDCWWLPMAPIPRCAGRLAYGRVATTTGSRQWC
jgi:2-polyprenyl-6-methoxyphenol hydroxylase-like FAD-dependent oxidoreductase